VRDTAALCGGDRFAIAPLNTRSAKSGIALQSEAKLIGTASAINADDFRSVMSRFATGVCIATSRDASGNPIGMTINSFNSVSLDPPLILWTVGRQAPEYNAFCQASEYVIHILRDSESALSTHFATPSDDKFVGQNFDLSAMPKMRNPWLMLECRAEHSFAAADHNILVGKVTAIENNSGDDSALLYYSSNYRRVGEAI